jgi:hypothetical protein
MMRELNVYGSQRARSEKGDAGGAAPQRWSGCRATGQGGAAALCQPLAITVPFNALG